MSDEEVNIRQYKRTTEDIDEILALAKLNKEDLLPTRQTIYFANDLHAQNNYRFIQLNPRLQEHFKVGDTLYINGEKDDNAVLVSEDATYDIINTETSNSLLLAEDLQFSEKVKTIPNENISEVSIVGVFYDYLEVIQRQPQFNKLQALLEKTAYQGPEHEYKVDVKDLYSFDELWLSAQSSKVELEAALKQLQTVTVNGKIRMLDFEYHFRVLSYMLKLIEENSWQLDEIDQEVSAESLVDLVPAEIFNSVFDLYTEESKIREGTQLYRYKEVDVCRFLAQVLLYSAGKFNLREFLQAWQESVPEGMQTDIEMLNGIAIIDRKAVPNVVWSFPESNLPMNIIERFKVLFNAKEKWSVTEITPYIKNLTSGNQDVNVLLTKYARPSKIDGTKYYSSKHNK